MTRIRLGVAAIETDFGGGRVRDNAELNALIAGQTALGRVGLPDDIGAAIAGGIGLAASGNIDPSRKNPSMFEPVHGSAPDIAGQGKADPTATVLSVAMLLDHIGEFDASQRVEAAVASDLATRTGTRTTSEIGDALATAVTA